MHQPPLLRRAEVAARLQVSIATVKRWGAAGLLDERHVGPRLVRITEASVVALAAKRMAPRKTSQELKCQAATED